MKPDAQADREERIGGIVIKSVAFFGGALIGALIGGLFLSHFVAAFVEDVAHPALYCALAGGLVGGLSAYRKAAAQIRRQKRMGEVADQLGLEHAADGEEQLEEHLQEMFSGTGNVSVTNVVRRQIGSAQLMIGDLTRTSRRSGSSSSRTRSTTRTFAYFESPDLRWPTFTLQPEGMLVSLFSDLVGVQDIDFDEFPVFSQKYHLSGRRPDRVRCFFTPDLLQYFTDNPGLEVRADENRVALVRPGDPCEPDELEAFIQQATEVFTQLTSAFVASKAVLDAAGPEQTDPQMEAAQLPGLAGMAARRVLAQRVLVTSEELEAFLTAAPPRQIPANIKRQRLGGGSVVAGVLGTVFLVVGSALAVYSAFYAGGPWNDQRIVPLILGIVLPLIGLPMCIFSIRYRHINGRLLRHGIVVNAIVEDVEKTDVRINDQQQYRMRLRFETNAGSQVASCNVYGQRGREARSLAEANEAVRVLYDPRNSRRILWAESLLTE